MPCRDWDQGNLPTTVDVCALQEALKEAPKASLLCEACALLEEAGILTKASKELKAWYKKHESKETNKVRLEAAEKLSERERRLLKIDIEALRAKTKK